MSTLEILVVGFTSCQTTFILYVKVTLGILLSGLLDYHSWTSGSRSQAHSQRLETKINTEVIVYAHVGDDR